MTSRGSANVRTKIVALLAALAALWGFAAWVTVRDGLNLVFVNTLDSNLGRPTEVLVDALQQERKLSAMVLGGAAEQQHDALADGRARTDEAIDQWRDDSDSWALRLAASDTLEGRIDEVGTLLDGLDQIRAEVDGGTMDRFGAVADYTTIVDAGFGVYSAMSGLDDQEITRQADALVTLSQARELISRQDALVAGALAAGELTSRDITELTQFVGGQRFLYEATAAELPPEDLALYEAMEAGPELQELRRVEEMLQEASPGRPPLSSEAWEETVGPALSAVRDMELAATDNLIDRATPAAIGVVVRLLLAGALGLVAVVAAVVISFTTARDLVRQLERLRDAARDLAEDRLPRVVERLSVGERVDVSTEAPPLRFGSDEIGQVGQAFNSVQETAVRAAVQQAELRRGVRDVFLSLARRTQSLVHKQLGVLDGVERRVTDADEMEELFRIDHLATRMRRNAENLIVLAGANSGRTWRHPVSMIDVIRGALAEVEDYTRVNLLPVEAGALEGRVVGDVMHLLAELIENAASFSPPYAPVTVSGQRVAHGFAVEIEDRGLGMSEDELQAVNRQLANPPDFSLADASRLGHYVVAKLSQRHGVKVHLRPSPYGGVAAIVLIPAELLVDGETETPVAGTGTPAGPTRAIGGPNGSTEPEPVMVRHRPDPLATPTPISNGQRPGTTPAVEHDGTSAPGADTGAGVAPARTPSGLPWRVRQASLPRQLRENTAAPDDDDATDEQPARDPEVVRRMMQAYQRGTQLGRSDADSGDGAGPTPHSSDSQEG